MTWRRLAAVTALVAVAGAAALVVRGSGDSRAGCDRAFDARGWKAPDDSRPGRGSTRLAIADDLVRCGTLIDKTRAEVATLLGRPEYPARPDETGPCYDLGAQPELGGLDNRVLCLAYGAGGRVERASVATS